MGRPRHALNVTPTEIRRIQELFVDGMRIAVIAERIGRGESTVYRAVHGMQRRRPPPPTRNAKRDARIVELVVRDVKSLDEVATEFGISKTRVCEIVRVAQGLKPRRIPKNAGFKTTKLAPAAPAQQRPLTRAQVGARNRLIVRLAREGVSQGRIGVRFGISRQRVHQILMQATARQQRRVERAARNAEIVRLAREGMGPTRIGRLFGLSKPAVQYILKRQQAG